MLIIFFFSPGRERNSVEIHRMWSVISSRCRGNLFESLEMWGVLSFNVRVGPARRPGMLNCYDDDFIMW